MGLGYLRNYLDYYFTNVLGDFSFVVTYDLSSFGLWYDSFDSNVSSRGFLGFYRWLFLGIGVSENALHKFINDKTFEKLKCCISNYGFWSIILFRISLFLLNDAISMFAGMVKMKYIVFIMLTVLEIVPLAIAIALFTGNLATLKIGLYWIGEAGIMISTIFIYVDHRKRKKSD